MGQAIGFLALFLPGIVLLHFLKLLRVRDLGFLHIFSFGIALSFFLIALPTTILYHLVNLHDAVPAFFEVYGWSTVGLYAIYLAFRVTRREKLQNEKSLFPRFRLTNGISASGILLLTYISLLTVSLSLLTIFSPLFLNYDALSLYLPAARVLIDPASRGLIPAIETLQPPVMPAIYGWMFYNSLRDYLRLVPIILLLALITGIYAFCEALLRRHLGSMAVAAVLTLPGLSVYLLQTSLYLDLPLAVFFLLSLLALVRARTNPNLSLFLLGMTVSNVILVKETGVFLGFLIVGGTLLLSVRGAVAKFLGICCSLVPFISLMSLDLLTQVLPDYPYPALTAIRAALVTILLLATLVAHKKFMARIEGLSHRFLLLFCFLGVATLFYATNFVRFGAFSANFASSLLGSLRTPLTAFAQPPIVFLQLQSLFQSVLLTFPILLPLIAGLFLLVTAKFEDSSNNTLVGLLFYWFMAGYVTVAFLGADVSGSLFRRGLALTPLMCMISAIGGEKLMSVSGIPPRYRAGTFTAIVSGLASYTLFSAFAGDIYLTLIRVEYEQSTTTIYGGFATLLPWLILTRSAWLTKTQFKRVDHTLKHLGMITTDRLRRLFAET